MNQVLQTFRSGTLAVADVPAPTSSEARLREIQNCCILLLNGAADHGYATQLIQTIRSLSQPEDVASGGDQCVGQVSAVERPWGWFRTLTAQPGFQVKEIFVRPGAKLSLQRHRWRAEQWVVASGEALVTLGERQLRLGVRGYVDISAGEIHRLENRAEEPLRVIEVQTGPYLGEDDIERLADDYGRAGTAAPGTTVTDQTRSAVAILGIAITTRGIKEVVADACRTLEGAQAQMIVACANPHSLVITRDDPLFRAALANATHVLPDGIGIVWAARLCGWPIRRRITGWDFFYELMQALETRGGGRVFFLGSSPSVIERIGARVPRDFPHVTLCGSLSPPYGEWPDSVDEKLLAAIERSRPDVLWVGMTAPKQERWVEKNRHKLRVPVIASVGAVFDFYAGTFPRAPEWVQRMGFEWLPRLIRSPRRLWRRTFISAPRFMGLAMRQHLAEGLISKPAYGKHNQ